MFADNHENEVENPNNVESKDETDKSCNNFTLFESCDKSANPRCHRNDCQDNAYDVTKSEIVAFFCHKINLTIVFDT